MEDRTCVRDGTSLARIELAPRLALVTRRGLLGRLGLRGGDRVTAWGCPQCGLVHAFVPVAAPLGSDAGRDPSTG
jgi:hypothetical protein